MTGITWAWSFGIYRNGLAPQDAIGSGTLKINDTVSKDALEWTKPEMIIFTDPGDSARTRFPTGAVLVHRVKDFSTACRLAEA